MASIRIIEELCTGCKKCLPACPFNAIEMTATKEKKRLARILDNCTLCGSCVSACKFEAIDFTKDEVQTLDISQCQGLWVFCEQFQGKLRTVGLELLGQARSLADTLNTPLTAVLIGSDVADLAPSLIAHGADTVLLVEEPWLGDLHDMHYKDVMVELARRYLPSILLLGATSFGRSLAPRIGAALRTGLTADCTVLEADPEKGLLLQTRPAFGGNLMATIICPNHRPQMATVRPKVFSPLPADYSRSGEIRREKVAPPRDLSTVLLDFIRGDGASVNINDADILVAVGKGIGNANQIRLAQNLADLLGGAVAVSRPLVDACWMGYSHQVGQTGKTVAPKLYLACGISGAVQHVAGIAAETVVAVNTDPEAPIFQYAHYAIVGDCIEFLEQMADQIKEHKQERKGETSALQG